MKKNLPINFEIIILVIFSISAVFIIETWNGDMISYFMLMFLLIINVFISLKYSWIIMKLNRKPVKNSRYDLSDAYNLIFTLVTIWVFTYSGSEAWNNEKIFLSLFYFYLLSINIILTTFMLISFFNQRKYILIKNSLK